jgi:hemolysin activation/secretion protein
MKLQAQIFCFKPGYRIASITGFFMAFMHVTAWSAPDAGSLLQQLESRPATTLKAPRLNTPEVPTPAAAEDAGPMVQVKEFRIVGGTLLSQDALQSALRGFTNKDLTLTQLQEAAWVVTQTYRKAGWLVNAYLPQQEIEGGQVLIRVVEARLGRVHLDLGAQVRVNAQQIQAVIDAQLQPGELLSLSRVDHAILLVGELAGVSAKGSFVPSQNNGASDLLVIVGGGKPVDLQSIADNFGGRNTGAHRVSTQISLNSALGMGDLLNLNLVETQGSRYQRASFTMPVGARGVKVGFHSSDMSYGFAWNNADLNGLARTQGVDVSVPVIRSENNRWSWGLSTDKKQLHNTANEAVTSDYRIELARSSLNGTWFDEWLGEAQNNLDLTLTQGNVFQPADTTGVQGRFNKFNMSFNREQQLINQLSWFLQAQTQSTQHNLDSSEKLYLGGAAGVRAYPGSEVGGASGYLASTGLRHRMGGGWTLTGFVDWGSVTVCRTLHNLCLKDKNGGKEPAVQALQGYGLSLNWQTEPSLDVNVTWSRRHGQNPNPYANGVDSDQTLVINRLWLSAAARF